MHNFVSPAPPVHVEYENKRQQLVDKHPLILSGRGWPSVGDGWLPIIDRLCTAIQTRVVEKQLPQLQAVQIKEKFGGLRFYTNGNYDAYKDLTEAAEAEAAKTCEVCGEPGQLRSGSWLRTTCEEHK